ncbi:MAG: hypothetical protein RIR70_209 [Pseudomonadota bacterium]|jgi:hypothetical protein
MNALFRSPAKRYFRARLFTAFPAEIVTASLRMHTIFPEREVTAKILPETPQTFPIGKYLLQVAPLWLIISRTGNQAHKP